jgi:SAM-dependent methyltransferase
VNGHKIKCPVCASPSQTLALQPGWGTWQQCSACTLVFADPLRLPTQATELFDGAYRGVEADSGFQEFAHRVAQREALVVEPELWFWTPAFSQTLEWLEGRVGREGRVLEIGCGLGFFLHALRRRGFRPVGLDVAETVVEMNRRDGFDVWHGTVETVDPGWQSPDAVVAMFMLHHLVDPVETLRTIRTKWPTAPIAIAQYGPSNTFEYHAESPRNLTRWNSRSLATALSRAGYRAVVHDLPSTGEGRVIRAARRLAFTKIIRSPGAYRVGKRIADRLMHSVTRSRGEPSFVLLAFAEPEGVDATAVPARPTGSQSGVDVATTA